MPHRTALTEDDLAHLRLLLVSVIGLGSDLDHASVQRRLLQAACEVGGARQGRLEVLDRAGGTTHVLGPDPVPGPLLMREVRVEDRLLARLALFDREDEFDDHDLRRVDAVVLMAAHALRNAEAHAESERLRRGLEAAMEVSRALSTVEPTQVLETITATARRVLGATGVALLGPATDLPDERGGLGPVLAGDRALPDPYDDPDVLVVRVEPELVRAHHLVVGLGPGGTPLSSEDEALVATFADQAATALDRAIAARDRDELALVSERNRIARDLHDVVIQRLYATGLQLRIRARTAAPDELLAGVSQAVADLDETIRDIRSTIFALRRHGRGSLRLDVVALVEEYAVVLGHAPRVRVDGDLDGVPDCVAVQLLASLREALANVAKHAGADSVRVELRIHDGWLDLEVVDDGRGMGDAEAHGGLHNLLHRARSLGGTAAWDSGADGGTTLTWRVPLSA